MVNNIFLALGSNKGNRAEYIREAIGKIHSDNKCNVLKCSSLYETTPYGNPDQPNFFNGAIQIESEYKIDELLTFVKNIEVAVGRTEAKEKWAQREIDVDIIFYNDLIYTADKIVVPHPECLKRDFVMIPLLEIAGNFIFPGTEKKISGFDPLSLENHIIKKIDFTINI